MFASRGVAAAALLASSLSVAATAMGQTTLALASSPEMSTNHSFSVTSASSSNPLIAAKTLSGRLISLPTLGRLTLIIGTLDADADRQAADWWVQANALCARHAVLDCYQAAEPGPRLRQSVSRDGWDRFAVLQGSDVPWKQFLQSAAGAKAYAMLLGPNGQPIWQAAGQAGEAMPTADLDQLLLVGNF